MSLTTKILLIVGSIITLGLLSVIVYQQVQISHRQEAIQEQVVAQKQLVDNIMRSQNQYATRDDINKLIKESGVNLKAIQDDLDKLHASVTSVNSVKVDSNGVVANNLPSTSTGNKNPNPVAVTTVNCDGKQVACPGADEFGYLEKEQKLELTEPFANVKVPMGTVGFSAWQKDPWSLNILPREYTVTTVVGTDENERQFFYNKFQVKAGDKTYPVQINKAVTEQVYPESHFSWWNPRLILGFGAGVNVSQVREELGPTLTLGIMSYGRYKTSPDFSILEVGAGYGAIQKTPELVVTPFTYNIGKNLPLINNTYVGPTLMLNYQGNFSVLGAISVGL